MNRPCRRLAVPFTSSGGPVAGNGTSRRKMTSREHENMRVGCPARGLTADGNRLWNALDR